MFTIILYIIAIILLTVSFFANRSKTKQAVKSAFHSVVDSLPLFLCILIIMGTLLSILDNDLISQLIGRDSGVGGMAIAAVIGSVALMPSIVAFPMASSLLDAGAGYGQITMFLSTVMMVGVLTLPAEIKSLRLSTTIKRNLYFLVYCIISAFIIGAILS